MCIQLASGCTSDLNDATLDWVHMASLVKYSLVHYCLELKPVGCTEHISLILDVICMDRSQAAYVFQSASEKVSVCTQADAFHADQDAGAPPQMDP